MPPDDLSWFQPTQQPVAPRPRLTLAIAVSPLEPSLVIEPDFLSWQPSVPQPSARAALAARPRIQMSDRFAPPIVVAVTDPPRVQPRIFIQHDEAAKPRSRKHEQDVAMLINELVRAGELVGTVQDPALGYVVDDIQSWRTTPPSTIKDALDRIAALLKSMNGGTGP